MGGGTVGSSAVLLCRCMLFRFSFMEEQGTHTRVRTLKQRELAHASQGLHSTCEDDTATYACYRVCFGYRGPEALMWLPAIAFCMMRSRVYPTSV